VEWENIQTEKLKTKFPNQNHSTAVPEKRSTFCFTSPTNCGKRKPMLNLIEEEDGGDEQSTTPTTDKRYEEHAQRMNKRQAEEWERYAKENPEWAAQAREHGLIGPDPFKDYVKGGGDREAQERRDFAMESVPMPEAEDLYETDLPDIGHDSEIEKRARRIASEIIHEALQILTRSDLAGLRRAADTLVLAIRGDSEDESQAALGRKYKISRAAVSLDIKHIQEHGSFGLITERYYNKEKRQKSSERAKEVHKRNHNTAPPDGSLAALLTANIQAATTISKTAKRKTK